MTSNISNSNIFDIDGLHLAIREPNLIVLPIPDNNSNTKTCVEIKLYLINNTPNSFYLNLNKTLSLELLAPDGEALQAQLTPGEFDETLLNRTVVRSWDVKLWLLILKLMGKIKQSDMEIPKVDARLIESQQFRDISFTIELLCFNNKLQLQILNNSSYLQTLFRTNKCWSLNNLQQGAYQFRFLWGNGSNSESDPEIQAGQLTTQFVNLHLMVPVGNEVNAIEVEGIRFETFLPERTFVLPKKKRGLRTYVQLGIHIRNNTLVPVHFSFFGTLIPQLIQEKGQLLKGYCYRRAEKRRLLSDFKLVMPGERITFFPYAYISWLKRGEFILHIEAGDRGWWNFVISQVGKYQIQFIYNNKYVTQEVKRRESMSTILMEGLWTGMVCTPPIEFCLGSV